VPCYVFEALSFLVDVLQGALVLMRVKRRAGSIAHSDDAGSGLTWSNI